MMREYAARARRGPEEAGAETVRVGVLVTARYASCLLQCTSWLWHCHMHKRLQAVPA